MTSLGLAPERTEVIACEAGHSVPGVSTSRIQEAIDSGQIVLVQDAAQLEGAINRSGAQ